MKILITGICGFVGSTLAQSLLEASPGTQIIGVDNLCRPGSELNRVVLQKLGVMFHHADIRQASDIDNLPAANAVIDAAANPSVLAGLDGPAASRQLVEHNCSGTINLLEYCKRHQTTFIMLSTSRVYSIEAIANLKLTVANDAFALNTTDELPVGVTTSGITEEFSTQAPISLYGATKLASEVLALEYGSTFDFPVWINRCGVLAGGGQFGKADQGIFSFWIHSWKRKMPLKYIGFGGHGHQVRDCLHPRDLLPLILKQIAYGGTDKRRVQNVAGGSASAMSLAQLSHWCEQRFGPHAVTADGNDRPFDLPWVVLNASLAESQWAWSPTTPTEAILEQIATHAENNPQWLDISRGS